MLDIRKRRNVFVLLAVALGLVAVRSASAALVPVLTSSGDEDANVPISLFTYTVSFSSSGGAETLRPGDTLTLYDVGPLVLIGYDAGTPALAAFTTSQPLVGTTPAGTAPTDNSAIQNVLLTYTGAATTTSFTFDLTLRQATAHPQTARGTFTSTDALAAGPFGAIGSVQLPTPVPEPTTLAGLGVAGLLSLVRRRRA